jgi:hypothetical protein
MIENQSDKVEIGQAGKNTGADETGETQNDGARLGTAPPLARPAAERPHHERVHGETRQIEARRKIVGEPDDRDCGGENGAGQAQAGEAAEKDGPDAAQPNAHYFGHYVVVETLPIRLIAKAVARC